MAIRDYLLLCTAKVPDTGRVRDCLQTMTFECSMEWCG